MPITSVSGCQRIAELAGGARFPAKLLRALQRCGTESAMVSRVGVHFALEQCHDLLDNHVAGIHFYTLNRSDATRTIFDSLGIPRAPVAGKNRGRLSVCPAPAPAPCLDTGRRVSASSWQEPWPSRESLDT